MNDTANKEKYTARDVERLIAARHAPRDTPREWALFFQLRNETGSSGDELRYVDAFALNLYPSKKHWRVAYEIKVSRADFLSELEAPEKRAFGMEISNEFWFACAPGVARPEEMPEGCGLLTMRGDTLVRTVAAKQRKARDLTLSEIASIARQSAHHETYHDTKWLYAGRELDEAALDKLVRYEADEKRDAHWREQANARVENHVLQIAIAVRDVKSALVEAGVAPMPWMDSVIALLDDPNKATLPDLFKFRRAEAVAWVAANVMPGPNAQDLTKLLEEHRALRVHVRRMARMIGEVSTDLAETLTKADGRICDAIRTRGGEQPAEVEPHHVAREDV